MHDVCELCRAENIDVREDVCERREALLRAEIQQEQAKVRRFKDDLVVQLYLREKGPFWDAIREVRERRNITARKLLPPSGPSVSELILPSGEGQLFEFLDWWLEELS
jgi:hypothetical protein